MSVYVRFLVYQIIPTSCFEMIESTNVSLYESQESGCQHVFCGKCGAYGHYAPSLS